MTFLDSFVEMPLLSLPVRSTCVESGASRILISPGSKLEQEKLKSLGLVTDLVATNLLHSGGIPQAQQLFPEARVWGVPGLAEAKPHIKFTHVLGTNPWPFEADLPFVRIEGMPKLNEVVFFHRASRTLIVSDLCFNLLDASGLGAWIILSLFGTYQRFGVSRFFLKGVRDRDLFEGSLKKIMEFDFERIAMGHGNLIERDGRATLRAALVERGFLIRGPGVKEV